MPESAQVTSHYSQPDLIAAIRRGVERLGKSIDSVTLEDLAPVDEFHIGGRVATEAFLDQLNIEQRHFAIDAGDHKFSVGSFQVDLSR